MKRAIVSVTNDLTTDQRVDRTCLTLVRAGYQVLLTGRQKTGSKTLTPRQYGLWRLRLLFEKGPLFYTEFNVRLFFFLLFKKFDLLVSNDLDTLPANFLAYRIHRLISMHQGPVLIHDCHEYFRGVPELNGRKKVTAVWKWIEDLIFPNIKYTLAVNNSIADLYSREYGNEITVIRNVPFRKQNRSAKTKQEFNISNNQKVILYQGSVNVDRGIEEVIQAMNYLKTDAVLVIAGTGDIFKKLVESTKQQGLSGKVRFLGQIPLESLHEITLLADLGLSVEKDVSVNYHYCLPNKFLDYIQANIPLLVSPFPEMKSIVDHYKIGEFIESHDPKYLADKIDEMLQNSGKLEFYRKNLKQAATDLCWENEEEKFLELLNKAV